MKKSNAAFTRIQRAVSPTSLAARRASLKVAPTTAIDDVPPAKKPATSFDGRILLSVAETARLLGISEDLVYREIHAGNALFPSVTIGRRVLIHRARLFAAFGLE